MPLEALLNPHFPFDPLASGPPPTYWVGPRHLAGDDGRLYDAVADNLANCGWTSLTVVRGQRLLDEPLEDLQVMRSTVLHISPDALRWAQWVLPDEPFYLGGLPVAWQVSARSDVSSLLADWSAYFTRDVPGEVIADFFLALDGCGRPAAASAGPEAVIDGVTAHGWFRDAEQPHAAAVHPTFTARVSLGEVPPFIQDSDPRALTADAEEHGPMGWQAWAEPAMGAPYLWAASFSASVPHSLVAAFATSLSSTTPVLRRVLPESTRDQLLWAPSS